MTLHSATEPSGQPRPPVRARRTPGQPSRTTRAIPRTYLSLYQRRISRFEGISSRSVTLTAPRRGSQSTSRFRWVPAAAGWTVGVIATLSLIASVSPVIRWIIKVPREFINDYLFNFPDTSFAWSFVLALLAGALTARKRIAWWLLVLNLLVAAGWNIGGLAADHNTALNIFGENLGLVLHVAALGLLVLA
jgi:lysyl-tRNA synthetase, class II